MSDGTPGSSRSSQNAAIAQRASSSRPGSTSKRARKPAQSVARVDRCSTSVPNSWAGSEAPASSKSTRRTRAPSHRWLARFGSPCPTPVDGASGAGSANSPRAASNASPANPGGRTAEANRAPTTSHTSGTANRRGGRPSAGTSHSVRRAVSRASSRSPVTSPRNGSPGTRLIRTCGGVAPRSAPSGAGARSGARSCGWVSSSHSRRCSPRSHDAYRLTTTSPETVSSCVLDTRRP